MPGQNWAVKTLGVLEALGTVDSHERPDGVTAAELSRLLDRDKSVVSRQLKNLVECGLVSRDESGHHELGWRLFALAANAGDRHLVRRAAPVMQRLTAAVRERSHLSVLSGGEVLTVRSESSGRLVEANGWVGRTVPVTQTSSGMALLMDHDDIRGLTSDISHLDSSEARELVARVREARERGYAVADRVFDRDVIGIGATIRDLNGRPVAALNISGPATRIEPHVSRIATHVVKAAESLSLPSGTHSRGEEGSRVR